MGKITNKQIRSQKREDAYMASRLRILWHRCSILTGNRARICQMMIDDQIEGLGYERERLRQRRIVTELERKQEEENGS